jgi:CheY-like chemotaxis protein
MPQPSGLSNTEGKGWSFFIGLLPATGHYSLAINMPILSGPELLPKAKAMRPDVPIIMITGYMVMPRPPLALENGAEALLTKPIDLLVIRDEIETRVQRAA